MNDNRNPPKRIPPPPPVISGFKRGDFSISEDLRHGHHTDREYSSLIHGTNPLNYNVKESFEDIQLTRPEKGRINEGDRFVQHANFLDEYESRTKISSSSDHYYVEQRGFRSRSTSPTHGKLESYKRDEDDVFYRSLTQTSRDRLSNHREHSKLYESERPKRRERSNSRDGSYRPRARSKSRERTKMSHRRSRSRSKEKYSTSSKQRGSIKEKESPNRSKAGDNSRNSCTSHSQSRKRIRDESSRRRRSRSRSLDDKGISSKKYRRSRTPTHSNEDIRVRSGQRENLGRKPSRNSESEIFIPSSPESNDHRGLDHLDSSRSSSPSPFISTSSKDLLSNESLLEPLLNRFNETHKNVLFSGIVSELIDQKSGILEMTEKDQERVTEPTTVYFHTSFLWVSDPDGHQVDFTSLLKNGACLKAYIPVGTRVFFYAVPLTSSFFQFATICIWPTSTDHPPFPDSGEELRLNVFLEEFSKSASLVQVSLTQFPFKDDLSCNAVIWQIKDENFGIIQVTGGSKGDAYRFFCLFHKDMVWLKDGQRAIDNPFLTDSPLRTFLTEDQKVQLVARSIVDTSGFGLKSSVLELQAITVYLGSESDLPLSIPRPHRCNYGTGTFQRGESPSWYFFEETLAFDLNKSLVIYLEKFQKMYPNINSECLALNPPKLTPRMLYSSTCRTKESERKETITPLKRPKSGIVSVKLPMGTPRVSMSDKPTLDKKRVSVSDKTTLATKRVCVSEKPPADKQWPFIAPPVQFEIRVERFEGRVISHLSSEALLIKGIDENYPSRFCLVPRNVIFDEGSQNNFQSSFPINLKLLVNAVLIDDSMGIQFIALVGWNPETITLSKDEAKAREIPLTLKELKMYHLSSEVVRSDTLRAREGVLVSLPNGNFGLACCDQNLVLFDVSDVWKDSNTKLSQVKEREENFLKIGDKLLLNANRVEGGQEITFMATGVWCLTDERDKLFSVANKEVIQMKPQKVVQEKLTKLFEKNNNFDWKTLKNEASQLNSIRSSDITVFGAFGTIISHLEGAGFVAKSSSEVLSWCCLVPWEVLKTTACPMENLPLQYCVGSRVKLDMTLLAKHRPVQYIAFEAARIEMPKKGNTSKTISSTWIQIYHKYSMQLNLPEFLSFAKGTVLKIIDGKIGIIESEETCYKVFFDVTDVLVLKKALTENGIINSFKRLVVNDIGRETAVIIFKVGDKVTFNAKLADGSASIPYIASGVWIRGIEEVSESMLPPSLPMTNFKIINYKSKKDLPEFFLKPNLETRQSFEPLPTTFIPLNKESMSIQQLSATTISRAPRKVGDAQITASACNSAVGAAAFSWTPFGTPPSAPPIRWNPPMHLSGPINNWIPRGPGLMGFHPPLIRTQSFPRPAQLPMGCLPMMPLNQTNMQTFVPRINPVISQTNSHRGPNQPKIVQFCDALEFRKTGIVIALLKGSSSGKSEKTLGGLIKICDSQKICFFLKSSCAEQLQINDLVNVDLHFVNLFLKENPQEKVQVDYVAVSVSKSNNPSGQPIRWLFSKSTFSFAKIALIISSKSPSLDFRSSFGIVDVGTAPCDAIQNVVIFEHLDAMITQDCGVMKCQIEGQEEFISCYFEFKDLNVTSSEEAKTLIDLLENMFGIIVTCKVIASSDVTIPFMIERFNIFGPLPHGLMHIKQRKVRSKMDLQIDKEVRFRKAVDIYKMGNLVWKRPPLITPGGLVAVPKMQQPISSASHLNQRNQFFNQPNILGKKQPLLETPPLPTQELNRVDSSFPANPPSKPLMQCNPSKTPLTRLQARLHPTPTPCAVQKKISNILDNLENLMGDLYQDFSDILISENITEQHLVDKAKRQESFRENPKKLRIAKFLNFVVCLMKHKRIVGNKEVRKAFLQTALENFKDFRKVSPLSPEAGTELKSCLEESNLLSTVKEVRNEKKGSLVPCEDPTLYAGLEEMRSETLNLLEQDHIREQDLVCRYRNEDWENLATDLTPRKRRILDVLVDHFSKIKNAKTDEEVYLAKVFLKSIMGSVRATREDSPSPSKPTVPTNNESSLPETSSLLPADEPENNGQLTTDVS